LKMWLPILRIGSLTLTSMSVRNLLRGMDSKPRSPRREFLEPWLLLLSNKSWLSTSAMRTRHRRYTLRLRLKSPRLRSITNLILLMLVRSQWWARDLDQSRKMKSMMTINTNSILAHSQILMKKKSNSLLLRGLRLLRHLNKKMFKRILNIKITSLLYALLLSGQMFSSYWLNHTRPRTSLRRTFSSIRCWPLSKLDFSNCRINLGGIWRRLLSQTSPANRRLLLKLRRSLSTDKWLMQPSQLSKWKPRLY
jgi:hypothetical protein